MRSSFLNRNGKFKVWDFFLSYHFSYCSLWVGVTSTVGAILHFSQAKNRPQAMELLN